MPGKFCCSRSWLDGYSRRDVVTAGAQKQVTWLQQDNASPHAQAESVVASARGLSLQVLRQPPTSPDLNVLDLGFFNGIQSVQYHKQEYCVPELIDAVRDAFDEMPV